MKTYALSSFLLLIAAWRLRPDQEPPPAVQNKSGDESEAPQPQQSAEPEAPSVPAASELEGREQQATNVFDRAIHGLWLLLDSIGAIFFLRQVWQRRRSNKPGVRDCAVQTDEAPRNMEMENPLRECAPNEKDCEAKAETQRVTECHELQERLSELCRSAVQALDNQDTELKDASALFSRYNEELKAYRDRNRELREEVPSTRVSTGGEESPAISVTSRARIFGSQVSPRSTGSPKARLKSRQDQGSVPPPLWSPPVLPQMPQQQQQPQSPEV